MQRVATVLRRSDQSRAVGDDREVTTHLDDRLLRAVHDPNGFGTQDLWVRLSQEFLGVLLSNLRERSSAAAGNQTDAETDRDDADCTVHQLVIRRNERRCHASKRRDPVAPVFGNAPELSLRLSRESGRNRP
jgi:hypothetical protein